MLKRRSNFTRRRFLETAVKGSTLLAVPTVIPGSALGMNGAVAPSERIVLGGIGIGNRGTYDLGCFLQEPDVQFVAVCDVKADRRQAIKKMVDQKYGNKDCDTYRDFRELLARDDIDAVLIATGPNWHCTAAIIRGPGRQGHVLREALHEEHCTEPDAGRDDAPHRPRVPGRHAAAEPAALRVRLRVGPHREARQAPPRLCPSRRA